MDDFLKAFEDFHIILTPTTLTTAPSYHEFVTKANREQCAVQDYCTQPINMAGMYITFIGLYIKFDNNNTFLGVPAISIPIKLSKSQMPLSIQIIARKLREPLLLAVAKYVEHKVNFNGLIQK